MSGPKDAPSENNNMEATAATGEASKPLPSISKGQHRDTPAAVVSAQQGNTSSEGMIAYQIGDLVRISEVYVSCVVSV